MDTKTLTSSTRMPIDDEAHVAHIADNFANFAGSRVLPDHAFSTRETTATLRQYLAIGHR
jgi:hypothetical protein